MNTKNNERKDMTSQVNFSRDNYNSQIPNYDTRHERLVQSSKTIFLGESAQEAEYNIKNMNKNRSPIYRGKEKDK